MFDKIDIMAFGPHPDDIELGMGGTIAKHSEMGYRIMLVDLTLGQMSTTGTPLERLEEAKKSAEILEVVGRENLQLLDRKIEINNDSIFKVVDILRKYRPDIVALPYWEDTHPDHVNSCRLIKEGIMSAALKKFESNYPSHRVEKEIYYFINEWTRPDFIVDVTHQWDKKISCILAHKSQFDFDGNIETPLNSNKYLRDVEIRARFFGQSSGVSLAEGFIFKKTVVVNDLMKLNK